MLNILFLGDIVGRSGRASVKRHLPGLIERYQVHLTVANVENAARGFGVTKKIVEELSAVGVDVMTTGNHTWDQREIITWISNTPNVLRPANLPEGAPGRGTYIATARGGAKVMVANAMGRLFMKDSLNDPFAVVDDLLTQQRLGVTLNAILLDFHAESTSETAAMGFLCDGRASVVVGTHTHVPTADAVVKPGGTAYQTDAGMCGDYHSVIGMNPQEPLRRFRTGMSIGRFEPATGEATLCGLLTQIDPSSGLAKQTHAIRLGGMLAEALPNSDAFRSSR